MPPAASVPLALVFYAAFWLVLGADRAFAFGAGFLARLSRLRHDPLPPAPPHAAHAGREAGCGSCTCATTSRTTSAASGSARRTGIACSAPCTSAAGGSVCPSWLTRRRSSGGGGRRRPPRGHGGAACVEEQPRRRSVSVPAVQAAALAATGLRRGRRDGRRRLARPHPARGQEAQEDGPDRRDRVVELVPDRRPPAAPRRRPATRRRRLTVLVREVVRPRWTFRLGPPSLDGLTRRRGDGLVRLLHVDGAPVVVAVVRRRLRRARRVGGGRARGHRADALRRRASTTTWRRSTSASATTR